MRFDALPQHEECVYYVEHNVVEPQPLALPSAMGLSLSPASSGGLGLPPPLPTLVPPPVSIALGAIPLATELVRDGRRIWEKRRFRCAKNNTGWAAETVLGVPSVMLTVIEGKYRTLAPNETAYVGWLNSCAAAFYLFDRGGGVITTVAVHAMTGCFKGTKDKDTPLPSELNEWHLPWASIRVVFATPREDNHIDSWGEGIGQLLADGVPPANLKVIYGVKGGYYAAGNGTFGDFITTVWRHGDLRQRFTECIDAAWLLYAGQFPVGTTTLRFPHHDRTDGQNRVTALQQKLAAAKSAARMVEAMKEFFAVRSRSFKANSLKRFLVAEMNTRFAAGRPINSEVTAGAAATYILDEIRLGRL